MSRRRSISKRVIKPDNKYNSILLSRFINKVMYAGKKHLAEKIVYLALIKLEESCNIDPMNIFNCSIQNVKPYVELRSIRVGGSNYQVPSPVDENRACALAFRWIILCAKSRPGKSMVDKLYAELLDAYNKRGMAFKKRDDTHKMAEANKAFSHFAQKIYQKQRYE